MDETSQSQNMYPERFVMNKNGRRCGKQSRTLKYKIYKINPDIILVLLFLRNNIWCIIISNDAKILVRKIIHLC